MSTKHYPDFLDLLSKYSPRDQEELACKTDFLNFVSNEPRCFERSTLNGHITGSGWVLNSRGTHVLLMHHVKLDCWVQLGGHADGNSDIHNVALREAMEESGIGQINFVSRSIFDIDIHEIPEYKRIPQHLHYDVRFLMKADEEAFRVNQESKELKWVGLKEVYKYSSQPSMLRMATKSLEYSDTFTT